LMGVLDEDPENGTAEIVPSLLDDAHWLTDFLAAPFHTADDDDVVVETRRTVDDITDLIQLMEIERTSTAAADATCLMLQIRRDIQTLLAA